MKRILLNTVILSFIMLIYTASAYTQEVKPAKIGRAVYHDVVGPIRDFPALTAEELAAEQFETKVERNEELKERLYPFAETATPKGPDPLWQKEMGTVSIANRDVIDIFSGQSSYSYPPDDNGTVGYDYYMQTINVKYTIYDKSGNLLAGPTNVNTLFAGVPGANRNDGDPIVMFDEQIGRFFVAEFSGTGNAPDYMLIAISQTEDPTGMWDRWSFPMTGFPDYMKFGIWRDAYYMGTNTYSGNDIYAFERDVMIAGGDSPQMVQFNNPWRPNSGFHCVLPVDNDGEFAPEGTPGMFMTINDNAWGGSSQDQLWIYALDVDWADPGNSTFNRVQQLDVEPFDSNFGSTWENIVQPGTSQKLDAIPQILMHRVQYRNLGSSQRIVCQHTVDVDHTNHAGIRWYELILDGSDWDIRQSGTYAPDEDNRWMGSIAMNVNHEIALGYSVSSSSTYPSIRITGQTAAENEAASGILDVQEISIQEGTASQTSSERWGDYANLAVDPTDELTFWFTTEYNISSQQKGTKVASFSITTAPLAAFHTNTPVVPTGQSISFIDDSYGNPTEWSWYFEGATPSGSTEQNPENIAYSEEGTYDVELTVTNEYGDNTITKQDYITVSSTVLPEIDFSVNKDILCIDETAVFTDLSEYIPITWDWQFDPPTVTFVNGTTNESQNPEVVFDEPGIYSVTLTAANLNGSSSLTQSDFLRAGGYPLDFLETFEGDSFEEHDWTIENPDDDVTWELYEIGGTTPGNTAIGIDFSDYVAIGQRDRFISPTFNLSGLSTASLSFEHAYAKKYDDASDSLIIYISDDCGATWTRIFADSEDGSGNFATHEMTDNFWPEVESDWCMAGWGASCIDIDVSQYTGSADVRFAFETYSFYGNPMFIDNIVVSPTVGLGENTSGKDELMVYPNPTHGSFTVVIPENTEISELQVMDYTSKIMHRQNVSDNKKTLTISTDKWAPGVYIIRALGNNNIFAKKVVKY